MLKMKLHGNILTLIALAITPYLLMFALVQSAFAYVTACPFSAELGLENSTILYSLCSLTFRPDGILFIELFPLLDSNNFQLMHSCHVSMLTFFSQ